MTAARTWAPSPALAAVTFDFANTLVPVSSGSFRTVVGLVLEGVAGPCRIADRAGFLRTWGEERDRQFREDVPAGREVDLAQRVARVLARVRGVAAPPATERWDDDGALTWSTPSERALIIDLYSRAFIRAVPPPVASSRLLDHLAKRGLRLAILSNWPLSATIERYVAAAGWAELLSAVVVSQRVGAIKPSPLMFAAAEREIGVAGPSILHVGDDWTADVVGAKRAGWRACYLKGQEPDWPRQPIRAVLEVRPDLTIATLEDLEAALPRPWMP